MVGGEAGQAFLVGDGGDAEPSGLHQLALESGEPACSVGGIHRLGAERTGYVAQAVLAGLFEVGVAGEDVLHRSHVAADVLDSGPGAAELGELLLQGHFREQGVDPLGTGAGRVGPRCGHGAFLGVVAQDGACCSGRRRGGRGCGGGPDDELGGQFHPVAVQGIARGEPEQGAQGRAADLGEGLPDGGQGRGRGAGGGGVVEADDADVLRYAQPLDPGGLDDTEGLKVVGGEDGRGRIVEGEEFQGGLVRGFEAEGPRLMRWGSGVRPAPLSAAW